MLSNEKLRRASRDLSRAFVNRHQQIFFGPHVGAQLALVSPQPLRRQSEAQTQEHLLVEQKKLVQTLVYCQDLGKTHLDFLPLRLFRTSKLGTVASLAPVLFFRDDLCHCERREAALYSARNQNFATNGGVMNISYTSTV